MFVKHLLPAAIALSIVIPFRGEAFSINTVYKVNGAVHTSSSCPGSINDAGVGTTTCDASGVQNNNAWEVNLSARANLGSIGISGSVSGVGLAGSGYVGGSSTGGSVSQNYFDTLYFGIGSGTFLLPVDISGSMSAPTPPGSVSGGGGTSIATMNIQVQDGQSVHDVFYRYDSSTTGTGDNNSQTGNQGTTVLGLAIVNGKVDLLASMNGTVGCSGRFDGGPCTAGFDFFNSARFLAGTVLDDSGQQVSNPTVTSDSGFDYLAGLEPHISVPLPASFLLLAGTIFAFGFARRKRIS